MASLALERDSSKPAASTARHGGDLIDSRVIIADLEELAAAKRGNDIELRAAMAQRLKAALNEGHDKAERLLLMVERATETERLRREVTERERAERTLRDVTGSRLAVAAVYLGTMMATIAISIVNVALPAI